MSNLGAAIGEVRFTVEVTRKETGLVEKYDMVGTAFLEDEPTQEVTPLNKE